MATLIRSTCILTAYYFRFQNENKRKRQANNYCWKNIYLFVADIIRHGVFTDIFTISIARCLPKCGVPTYCIEILTIMYDEYLFTAQFLKFRIWQFFHPLWTKFSWIFSYNLKFVRNSCITIRVRGTCCTRTSGHSGGIWAGWRTDSVALARNHPWGQKFHYAHTEKTLWC